MSAAVDNVRSGLEPETDSIVHGTIPMLWHALIGSSRALKITAVLALIIVLVGIVAPFLVPYDPYATDYSCSLAAPSAAHWFGCDAMGRDVFSRVLCGTRVSVFLSLVAIALPLVVGTILGAVAAYAGGWVDEVLMRIADVFQAFPEIILGVAIVGILGPGLMNAVFAVMAVLWIRYARLTRSLVLQLLHSDFIDTARMSGARPSQILFRHMLPSIAPQLLVGGMLDLGFVMLTLASFSFLGLGIQPPTPEWGSMLNDGRFYFASSPHLMVYPGCALFITVLVFNLLGNCLSDRINKGRKQA